MVDELLAGGAPFGFCAMRPPGHHAERATAMGFCLFNNVAIAAQHALERGAERVLVSTGTSTTATGRTTSSTAAPTCSSRASTNRRSIPGTGPMSDIGSGAGEGYSLNLPVPPGSGERHVPGARPARRGPGGARVRPGIVLVSAGYDAHREDPLASCELDDELVCRARGVRPRAGRGARRCRSAHCSRADTSSARSPAPSPRRSRRSGGDTAPPDVEPDAVTARAVEHLGRWWPLAAVSAAR